MAAQLLSKSYLLFGDCTDLITLSFNDVVKSFQPPEFVIGQYVEQAGNPIAENRGISITSNKRRTTIKIVPNRIELLVEGIKPDFDQEMKYLVALVNISKKKFNRIAIHQTAVINDSDDKTKKDMAKKVLGRSFDNNSINDFSFRINEIKRVSKEEINAISSINSGFVQNFIVKNNVAYPNLSNALFFNTDINTSQKNLVERFDENYVVDMFSKLEEINAKTMESLIKSCE